MSNRNTHVFVQSQDRENFWASYPSNFRVLLPKSIKAECAELSFAQIPNTYYNINASNNSFQANGTPYSITPGSYNLNDLLQAIATTNLEISYNDIPNLISFSNVTTFTLNFNVSLSICVHLFSGS